MIHEKEEKASGSGVNQYIAFFEFINSVVAKLQVLANLNLLLNVD